MFFKMVEEEGLVNENEYENSDFHTSLPNLFHLLFIAEKRTLPKSKALHFSDYIFYQEGAIPSLPGNFSEKHIYAKIALNFMP